MKAHSHISGPTEAEQKPGFLRQFFRPLKRPRLVLMVLVVSFVISGILTSIDEAVAKHAEANAFMTLFLASEMGGEGGPFREAKDVHFRILSEYIARMEARTPATIVALAFPKHSPRVQLRKAVDLLSSSEQSEVGCSNDIKQASVVLKEVGVSWSRTREPSLRWRGRMSANEARIVNDCMEKFEQSIDALAKNSSVEAAQLACMDSRLATEYLVSFWKDKRLDEKKDPSVERFIERLESLKDRMQQYANQEGVTKEERRLIGLYRENVIRRIGLVTTLYGEGRSAAKNLLLADGGR